MASNYLFSSRIHCYICWNVSYNSCIWAKRPWCRRATPTNSENPDWTGLSFRWRGLGKLERNKLKGFGSMQQHQNDSTYIRFFQRNKVCMYSIFDIAKNGFKIKSIYFSRLSTDTYAKMSDKVKVTSAFTRNRISGWMIIPSIQLCAFYVYAENVINL